jgi:hypothetical protein
MQVGDPIGEGWAIYKRFWRHLIPIALVISLVVSVIGLVLAAAGGAFAALAAAIVSIVGVFLIQAALTEAVADVRDGRADLTLGETIARVWPRVGPVIGVSLVAGLCIVVGLFLVVVPGLYLMTIWSVVVPAVVLERLGVFESLGRSRSLVSGFGWTVFGVILVTFLIDIVVSIVLGAVFGSVSTDVGHYLGNVVTTTVVTPFVAATWTCMYFQLRGLHEPATGAMPAGAAYSDAD